MTPRRATALAVGFFVFWLVVLAAGADHPPPPGFALVVLCDLVLAVGVAVRVRVWRQKGGWRRALLEGAAAGLAVAALFTVLPRPAEPGLPPPGVLDLAIWFGVLAVVGAVNAGVLYALAAWWPAAR